jgi:hypothetical protein
MHNFFYFFFFFETRKLIGFQRICHDKITKRSVKYYVWPFEEQ